MHRLFQIASLVLMGMMLFSMSPASAAVVPPRPVALAPNHDNCTTLCSPLVTTDDLLPVRGPLGRLDPCAPHPVRAVALLRTIDGLPPAQPAPRGRRAITCGGTAQHTDCAAPLGHLPKVSEREIRSVDGRDRIMLIPICDLLNKSLTQALPNIIVQGNAESLVPAISRNPVLTAALGHASYRADDVVGVTMGTNVVMLYVHKM